jgi:hypothetical protein
MAPIRVGEPKRKADVTRNSMSHEGRGHVRAQHCLQDASHAQSVPQAPPKPRPLCLNDSEYQAASPRGAAVTRGWRGAYDLRHVRRRASPILIGLAFVAFVSLGLPDCVLGVAWPSIRAEFAGSR